MRRMDGAKAAVVEVVEEGDEETKYVKTCRQWITYRRKAM